MAQADEGDGQHQGNDLVHLGTEQIQEFGIETRAGLHCAPEAHEWLQTTATGGTLRLSVGPFTTPQEIERTIEAFETLHRSE